MSIYFLGVCYVIVNQLHIT